MKIRYRTGLRSPLVSRRRRWAAVALLAPLLASCSTGNRPPAEPASPELPQAAEILASLEPRVPIAGQEGWTLEERMSHYRAPAVSLAVFDDYGIVWTAAFGMADIEDGEAATKETLFQAGSISKPVAAAAVLAAAERDEIDLDVPVNTLLTSWKLPDNEHTAKAPVTPRRLLSHTAGTTVHGFPGYAVDEQVPTVPQVLDGAPPTNTAPVRVDTQPGTIFRYSGGGSTIMQLAMTDLSGFPYPELMRRAVFDPIGMTDSTYEQPLPPDRLERAAAGYRRDGQPVWGKRHTYPEMAAAGLWTTPTDLARFALDLQRALRGDQGVLLEKATVEEMVTPVLGESGLGLFEIESEGALYFGHNGADEGFQALLMASREGGHGAAIMVNSDNGLNLAAEILPAIARALDWPGLAPEPLVPAEVDAEALEALTGLYRVRDHQVLEVTKEGDLLMARLLLDEEPTRLVPRQDGTFIAQDDGASIRFELGEDGRAVGYVNTVDEETAVRPRLEDTEELYEALLDAGRTDDAMAGLAEEGLSESDLNDLGYTLLRLNRPQQAVAVFRLVVEQHPDSANAYDSLGDGYLALEEPAAATEAFLQVLATLATDDNLPEERKPQYETRARTMVRRLHKVPGGS